MLNKPALRIARIGCTAWVLWSLIIYAAKPNPPDGVGKIIFLISMPLVAGLCVWASWGLFPQFANKPWRRFVCVLFGVMAFAAILGVGHALGTAIAAGT